MIYFSDGCRVQSCPLGGSLLLHIIRTRCNSNSCKWCNLYQKVPWVGHHVYIDVSVKIENKIKSICGSMSVVSHQSSGAHTDEVVCCGLIETGGLILQSYVPAGAWFHLLVSFLLDQSFPCLVTQSQLALFSPLTGERAIISMLLTGWNTQESELVQEISTYISVIYQCLLSSLFLKNCISQDALRSLYWM